MSRTLWLNIRAITIAWGLFLLWCPKTIKDASFFSEKNSRDDASSNGCMSFFLLNLIERGRLREFKSVRTSWTTALQDVPLSSSVVFGFSLSWGARCSSARFERALRGLLDFGSVSCRNLSKLKNIVSAYISRNIFDILELGFILYYDKFCTDFGIYSARILAFTKLKWRHSPRQREPQPYWPDTLDEWSML